jgi:hypothetical protein
MITLSIDVTQLDKTRFKTITRKNGNRAVFCDLILLETPNSDYGDYMVKQSLSKADREAKVELPILGNGKILTPIGSAPKDKSFDAGNHQPDTDDIPF